MIKKEDRIKTLENSIRVLEEKGQGTSGVYRKRKRELRNLLKQ